MMDRLAALVVQHDLRTGEFISQVLRDNGYDALIATSLVEGLSLHQATRPELLVIDPVLSDGDGFDLVRLAMPAARVIVTSAFPLRTADTAAKLGVPLLVKPFDVAQLIAYVN
jgi:DNA-binding response OmpR family regulator